MGDKNAQFVKCIQRYPCLYDYNDVDYLKKEVADKAWQEVAYESEISVLECKEKWKNLRYGLIRSLRLNPDGRLKKKYYLHDEMEFILPYLSSKQYDMSQRLDVEPDEDKNDQDNDNSYNQQYQDLELCEPIRKVAKRIDNRVNPTRLLENHDDYRRMFMLGLMPEINALNNSQMKIFRRRVLALLDEIAEPPIQFETGSRDSLGILSQDSMHILEVKAET